jgi:TetR/AcrR family transcriptional repressor of nem operon
MVSRQKIIEAAFELFHRKGISATSVDQILEKSGTGKSQFYYYFKSKNGLIHHVLLYFYEALKANRTPAIIHLETWEDLERWFEMFIQFQKSVRCEKGCPIGTIGNDVFEEDLLRQDIKLIFEFTRHYLTQFFVEKKAKGELLKSVDPHNLAHLCFTIQQGAMLVSKIERSTEPFERSLQQLKQLLESIRT